MNIKDRRGRLLLCSAFLSIFLFNCFNGAAAADSGNNGIINVGAIIDLNSEAGQQRKIAMDVAVQSFNNYSKIHSISLHFRDSGRNPSQAASAAEELINQKKVKVITGMETWQEASLVADLGDKYQVPVISFSYPSISSPSSTIPVRWPFLIQMAKSQTANMNCIADIVQACGWQKVITIYEDDLYSTDSGMLNLLSESLLKINSQIEHRLVLPPFSSLPVPNGFIRVELDKLLPAKSRVFIVLKASLPMVTHLFREAKKVGFLGKESAWIINEEIADMLDSDNDTALSSMEGTIGIKSYYSTSSNAYIQLKEKFQSQSKPGLYALQAYDSITVVTKALEKMNVTNNTINSSVFLNTMLSSNFSGLSGNIMFRESHLSQTPNLRMINVVNKSYTELDFWVPSGKFFKSLEHMEKGNAAAANVLNGPVVWPGGLNNSNPKGWKIPSEKDPLRVLVPANLSFEKFVRELTNETYDGLCIALFKKVIELLKYSDQSYKFCSLKDATYDDLVDFVANQTFDAIVGDVTILENRSKIVSFTQPYTESGLSLILPAKEGTAFLFVEPFSWQMWAATAAIFLYTTLAIWFLEHPLNPNYKGSWKNQLSNTFWFSFSSLFFFHAGKVYSNSARVVVVVWLVLVFILTSSYTASLSSMLAVKRMESGRDVQWLKDNNLTVGYYNRSTLVMTYLHDVYRFPEDRTVGIGSEADCVEKFKRKDISALFLESPYEKVFMNNHCDDYTATSVNYKFGGFGFVFQRGSPMAKDFSEVILGLAENGTLKTLEEHWLSTPYSKCSSNSTYSDSEAESLTIADFWVLYVISGLTSTIFLIVAVWRIYRHQEEEGEGNVRASDNSVWNKALTRLTSGLYNNGSFNFINTMGRAATFGGTQTVRHWNSSRWESVTTSDDHDQVNPRRTQSVGIELL